MRPFVVKVSREVGCPRVAGGGDVDEVCFGPRPRVKPSWRSSESSQSRSSGRNRAGSPGGVRVGAGAGRPRSGMDGWRRAQSIKRSLSGSCGQPLPRARIAAACVDETAQSRECHQPLHQAWLAAEPACDGLRRVDLHAVLGVPDPPAGTRPRHRRRCRGHAAPTSSVTGRRGAVSHRFMIGSRSLRAECPRGSDQRGDEVRPMAQRGMGFDGSTSRFTYAV